MNKDTSFIHSDCDVSSNLSNEETNYKSKDDFKLLNEKSKEINSTNKKGRKKKEEKQKKKKIILISLKKKDFIEIQIKII